MGGGHNPACSSLRNPTDDKMGLDGARAEPERAVPSIPREREGTPGALLLCDRETEAGGGHVPRRQSLNPEAGAVEFGLEKGVQ